MADLHLTLHFLGEMDRQAVARVLASVSATRPLIRVRGLGQFRLRGGRRIFWAGVEPTETLIELRQRVGRALSETGFVAETRPYQPHVTLARINRVAARHLTAPVAGGDADSDFGEFDAPAFHLFDTAGSGVPDRYTRLNSYALGH